MKLTGNLKKQVESAPTKEEKRETIKQAGMRLSDDELDQVSGGIDIFADLPPIEKDTSLNEGITRVQVAL